MRTFLRVLVVVCVLLLPVLSAQAAPVGPGQGLASALRAGAPAAAKVMQQGAAAPDLAAKKMPQGMTVVASGLDNPRGLAFGAGGALFVAEAGRGGTDLCAEGPEGPACFGNSSAITKVWRGRQTRIITGLPSLASPDGTAAGGASDVSMRRDGGGVIVIQNPGSAEDRAFFGPNAALFGHAIWISQNGFMSGNHDIVMYEEDHNPDGGAIDSDPYAISARPGGFVAADAAGNDVLAVGGNGKTVVLAVFPNRMVPAPDFLGLPPGAMIPMESVPNAITQGPDGAYYVGELTGFPYPVGAANVYRIVPGQAPTVFASGFTNIIDVAFGPDGKLYVLEIAANSLLSDDLTGALIRVNGDGSHTTVAMDGLVAPAGLAFGPDGAAYVSNFGIFPDMGEVVRITW